MLRKITYTIARIVAAFIMGQTLYFKFTGSPESMYIFTLVGIEPWGRWMAGITELIAAVLLLIPRTSWAGGILTVVLMLGAIGLHLTIIGVEVMDDRGLLFYYSLLTLISGLFVVFHQRDKVLNKFLYKIFKRK